jgi:hypothetical protein
MEGSSLHMPVIMGAGLGVSEGKKVSVGMGVSVFCILMVSVVTVGAVISEFLQEL